MKSKLTKILGIALASVTLSSAFTFAGCGSSAYKGDPITDYVSEGAVTSNGGFAVAKGDFVYFINGMEEYTAENNYGEVVKGALMRISKADLAAGNYANVKTIVPSLLAAQNYSGGVYIFGDYVYYATPTTDKSIVTGEAENDWIDFKRAKLDGTEAPMDGFFFRLSDNTAAYRFVEVDGVVYCLYEEDGVLKSYDTKDEVSRTLVSGADTFFYDTVDSTNGNVYYTMSVTEGLDTQNSTVLKYNQLYCVNAAARVESTKTENGKVSYTVKGGKTYAFDVEYLEEKNEEAKEKGNDEPYDLKDYATLPYVNLGELVLDGIGSNAVSNTQYNEAVAEGNTPAVPGGYTYALTMYTDHGVYFTRKEAEGTTSSDAESAQLYYLADAAKDADGWKAISGNGGLEVVAPDGSTLTGAIFTVDDSGNHVYYYLADNTLYKATPDANGNCTPIEMTRTNLTEATLWAVEGDYLYYVQNWADGEGNGYKLSRINVTGTQDDYNIAGPLEANEEYAPISLQGVQINSSWYMPEIFDGTLLYSNEQAFGDVSYNYIYAAKLGATQADVKANNEKYDDVQTYISEYDDVVLQEALTYYFRTGKRTAFDAVESLYTDYQVEEFNKFVEDATLLEESAFFTLIGKMTEEDVEEIDAAWAESLLTEKEEEEVDEGLPTWAIVLIIVSSVLVVACAAGAVWYVLRKKKQEKEKADATVNAYKRAKIDTTDDKSIDVYADEESETPAQEAAQEAEEPSEEKAEEQTQDAE